MHKMIICFSNVNRGVHFLATLGSRVYKPHISHFYFGTLEANEGRLMALELLCESIIDRLEIRSSN